MSRLDLRGRVTLASAAVLALGLALLTLGVNLLLSHQIDQDASNALRDRADAQLATIEVRGGRVALGEALRDDAFDQQAWVYAVTVALRRPRAPASVQRAADELSRASGPVERSLGEGIRLRAEPAFAARGSRRVGSVVVALSLVPYEHTERIALFGTLVLDLFVLAAGALLARRAVGNALRPVAEMTQHAAEWSASDLERRFNRGPPRDELTALSATLDALLARIGASLRHEQRFSAEMAHELRTPLSWVRGEAELALQDRRVPAEVRESLEEILRGTERMGGVISTLLAAARSDVTVGLASSDAAAGAERAVEVAGAVAERAAVRLRLVEPPARWSVGAESDIVVQALQPLLDNAVRHAGSTVTVALERAGDAVAFAVTDDGDGIDGMSPDELFEPGVSTEGGAGLGLPLARRLARSAGGDVVVVPVATGARFELRLPALG